MDETLVFFEMVQSVINELKGTKKVKISFLEMTKAEFLLYYQLLKMEKITSNDDIQRTSRKNYRKKFE